MKPVEFGRAMVSGEPLEVTLQDHKSALWSLGCCDCKLYHLFVLHREGDSIIIRPYRDSFLTEKHRMLAKKGKK